MTVPLRGDGVDDPKRFVGATGAQTCTPSPEHYGESTGRAQVRCPTQPHCQARHRERIRHAGTVDLTLPVEPHIDRGHGPRSRCGENFMYSVKAPAEPAPGCGRGAQAPPVLAPAQPGMYAKGPAHSAEQAGPSRSCRVGQPSSARSSHVDAPVREATMPYRRRSRRRCLHQPSRPPPSTSSSSPLRATSRKYWSSAWRHA